MFSRLFLFTISFLTIISCAPSAYYQVYKVDSVKDDVRKSAEVIYEDSNCIITYNFWSDGGDVGFDFYNKTAQSINIDLRNTHFILNGYANDYFKNRVFTKSSSNAISTAKNSTQGVAITGVNQLNHVQTNQVIRSQEVHTSSSTGYAVSFEEDSIIRIPAKSKKRVAEYSINKSLILNCDLDKHPSRRRIKTASYSSEDTPIRFKNIIKYNTPTSSRTVINDFYISEITNYPSSLFYDYKYEELCNQRTSYQVRYYKLYHSDSFYIRYR